MFLVVLGVLSLVLAFPEPPWSQVRDPAWVLTAVAVATLLPAALAALVTRRTIRLLDRNPADPGIGQFAYSRGLTVTQWVLGLVQAALIGLTDWLRICQQLPVIGHWPLLPGLVATLPLLLSILLVWIAAFPAERAIRQIALEVQLYRGRPSHPVWPLGRYLMFNLRHQVLFILAPLMLILLARDLIEAYERQIQVLFRHDFAPELLLGGAAVLVAVLAPVMLRYIWVTMPLPASPLRDQLLNLCRKLRMRCRDILIWKSGGMITNAAVMGVIPPLRYVMITDAMLEQMDDRKIEAVFGHEAGHVKRHHILFFLLFAVVSGCLITITGKRVHGEDRLTYQLITAAVAGLMLFKWGVLFGWISRRFERQADLFGVRTLALTGLPCQVDCALHRPAAEQTGRGGDPICRTAAHVFGDTLNEVAVLNNIPPEAWSWRHGSIASRSRILQKYALDPRATRRFERNVQSIKAGILLAAAASSLWAAWELKLWTILGLGA